MGGFQIKSCPSLGESLECAPKRLWHAQISQEKHAHQNEIYPDLSYDMVSTVEQLVDDMLFFIAHNTKTPAYELNWNLKNKSEWGYQ